MHKTAPMEDKTEKRKFLGSLVIPLIIFLPRLFGLGVYGVFAAEPVSDVLGGLACFLTMYFTV